jgi:PKD repeat protein
MRKLYVLILLAFSVNLLTAQSIVIGNPYFTGPFCPGQPISIPFSAFGTFNPINIYTVELSDAIGSFTSPIAIGSLNGNATSGNVDAIIPSGTSLGSLYQIRIVSSSPNAISNPLGIELGNPTAFISSASNSSICPGGSATLFYGGSPGTIQWSSSTNNLNFMPIIGATNLTLTINSLTQTTYYKVTVTNNCGAAISQVWTVTLNVIVNIPLSYSPNFLNVCNGPITVSVVGNFSNLVWSTSESGIPSISVSSSTSPSSSFSISVVGIDINGCPTESDPLEFIQTTPSLLSISPAGPTITICSNPANLNASLGFDTYTWSNGVVGTSNSVSSPGSYSVTGTDAEGCIVTSSPVIVQLGSSVVIPVSQSDSVICDNVPVTLTAGGSGFEDTSYVWSNGAIGQEITVSLPGSYSVTVINQNVCGESEEVTVSQAQFPVANFSYTQTSGYTISFDNNSQNGFDYEWIFDSLGTSLFANPAFTFPDSGPYQITLIASNPCSSDTITKTIVVTFVGIQDLDESANFSVSPNPSSGDFILTQNDTKSSISGLTLHDISGRVVYQNRQEIKGFSNIILPASNLPVGMYFLHFETLNGTVNIRLLKN